MFFKHQTFIPNGIRNKYYNRLRTLLINQYNAINHRLALDRVKNDNKLKLLLSLVIDTPQFIWDFINRVILVAAL